MNLLRVFKDYKRGFITYNSLIAQAEAKQQIACVVQRKWLSNQVSHRQASEVLRLWKFSNSQIHQLLY